jgi:hypothetical protein
MAITDSDILFKMPLRNTLEIEKGVGPANLVRTTQAYFVNDEEVLVSVPANTPVYKQGKYYNHREETNYIQESEDYTFTLVSNKWYSGNLFYAGTGFLGPDNNLSATRIETTGPTQSTLLYNLGSAMGITLAPNDFATMGTFIKADELRNVVLQVSGSGIPGSLYIDVDHDTGMVVKNTSLSDGDLDLEEYHIERCVNGFVRTSITFKNTGASTGDLSLIFHIVDGSSPIGSYGTADTAGLSAGDGLFIFGTQVNKGGRTDYIPSSGGVGVRSGCRIELPISNLPASPSLDVSASCKTIDIDLKDNRNAFLVSLEQGFVPSTGLTKEFPGYGAGDGVNKTAFYQENDGEEVTLVASNEDATDLSFYYDGVLKGSVVSATQNTSPYSNFLIGNANLVSLLQYDGYIYDVVIYNKALTAEEAANIDLNLGIVESIVEDVISDVVVEGGAL